MNNIGWVIVVMLVLIVSAVNPVATRHVLQLSCVAGGLSDSEKYMCSKVASVATDLDIKINTTTQKYYFHFMI
jgi:hypothetical protein